jgi:hypothetical protein
MDQRYYQRCRRHDAGAAERLVPAIVLIGIGALFLLNNLNIIYAREIFRFWPALIIAFGIVKLIDASDGGGRAGGGVIIGVGAIFMARSLGYIDVQVKDLWPLIPIAIGLMMLFERTSIFQVGVKVKSDSGTNESAIFSGGKRKISDQNFTTAKFDAVFGGFEIDMRQADIAGESAVLDLNAVFGGMEVKIPVSWTVVMKGGSFFGGFVDNTAPPDPRLFPNPKKLIVKGGAVFGGVEVKN